MKLMINDSSLIIYFCFTSSDQSSWWEDPSLWTSKELRGGAGKRSHLLSGDLSRSIHVDWELSHQQKWVLLHVSLPYTILFLYHSCWILYLFQMFAGAVHRWGRPQQLPEPAGDEGGEWAVPLRSVSGPRRLSLLPLAHWLESHAQTPLSWWGSDFFSIM